VGTRPPASGSVGFFIFGTEIEVAQEMAKNEVKNEIQKCCTETTG